jgi:AP-1 complex subunit beta-1
LITLLHGNPEVQFTALRNIALILQSNESFLRSDIKVFFCKYNDPIYVKLSKLDILCRLVAEENIDKVLPELKEYASEVDVDFVRKTVRSIGRCAIKLEFSAEKCVQVLLELIKTRISYVVQETVIVIKVIPRFFLIILGYFP